jgi:hypothetical protein
MVSLDVASPTLLCALGGNIFLIALARRRWRFSANAQKAPAVLNALSAP